MKSINGWLGRTLFMAVLFVAVPVWADEPAKPVAAAEEAYSEGKRLAEANKWLAAVTLFEKAYALDPSPNRAAHLGRAQVMTEAYAAGATNLERYLREEKNPPADRRAAIEELLRGAKEKVATVTLQLDEPGVTVRIGQVDVPTERLSWPQYVAPGTHVFEATKAGFEVSTETREVVAGSAIDVTFKMKVARVVKSEVTTQESSTLSPFAKVGFGVAGGLGAVGAGVAIAAGVSYAGYMEAYNRRVCEGDCDADVARRAPTSEGLSRAWVALLGSAAVIGGATAVIQFGILSNDKSGETKPNGKVSLMVVPGLGGLVVRGSW